MFQVSITWFSFCIYILRHICFKEYILKPNQENKLGLQKKHKTYSIFDIDSQTNIIFNLTYSPASGRHISRFCYLAVYEIDSTCFAIIHQMSGTYNSTWLQRAQPCKRDPQFPAAATCSLLFSPCKTNKHMWFRYPVSINS